MAAGESATVEAENQRLQSLEYQRLADLSREMHRRFNAAASSELRLARTLSVLESRGYYLLADRRWPNSRKAQVDFIMVGPGGVFVVDAKQWRDVHIENGQEFRDQDDVTDDFARIADLADSTRTTLADLGLAPGEVHAYAVFTNQRAMKPIDLYGVTLLSESDVVTSISRKGNRLTPTQIKQITDMLWSLFPIYGSPDSPDSPELDFTIAEPALPASAASITLADVDEAPLLTAEDIESALLEGVLTQPIEEWMAFLHPTQAKLVNRSFSGPSRVRGAAGTGKTVVGLHRAAHLARSGQGPVLVTTFVRTLPLVPEALLERLAPDVVGRVQFTGIYGFALDILKQRGIPHKFDVARSSAIFTTLLRRSGLLDIDPSDRYWEDKANAVIKGRGLRRFEEYATLARSGRRRRLTVDQRTLVWDLFIAYSRALSAEGICDSPDIIRLAETSLRANPITGYSAVVIDEAQDLSCMMVRMLHTLVGDKADGLNLIGDGQQTIYPGGFTLSEANISISGRGVVMTTNYRNTAEIIDFATSLVTDDEFIDIEGGAGIPDATTTGIRRGEHPTIARFKSKSAHDASLVDHIRSVTTGHVSLGDIGVLAMTNWQVSEVVKALTAAGIPTVNLDKYNVRSTDAVKVGTVHRAKGLEFKQVLVARTSPQLLDASMLVNGDAARERRDLDRRALYVAMTRARDGLWVGVAS